MARPSQNIDKKLIEVGKQKILESGIAGVNIRSICLDYGINLGMFHYYFKTKENFTNILLKTLSDDLINYMIKESEGLANSREKLKKVLMINAKMMYERKSIIENLIKDIDSFGDTYVKTLKEIQLKLLNFFMKITEDCKNEGFLDGNIQIEIIYSLIAGSFMHFVRLRRDVSNADEKTFYEKVESFFDIMMEKLKQ